MDQVKAAVAKMPAGTVVERRNRALLPFIAVTGARDRAVASMKLKHVDLAEGCVHQDAREVCTKFAKTFDTFFFPVWDEGLDIVAEWVAYLRTELLFGDDDPIFPTTRVELDENRRFSVTGLTRDHWTNTGPICKIFRDAWAAAGLPYFNPHSFRHMLARLGERCCHTPEQFKAWSQNLGHASVMTTLNSYGPVDPWRQGEIIKKLGEPDDGGPSR